MPASMRTGLDPLLFKKGDRDRLENWRPITLLPVDYKVVAKALAIRLRGVMALVVRDDQMGGVEGRSCGLSLSLIRDVVCWVDGRSLSLALLSLDQEKAFNRVSHQFLFLVLQCMGFGRGFPSWLRPSWLLSPCCRVLDGTRGLRGCMCRVVAGCPQKWSHMQMMLPSSLHQRGSFGMYCLCLRALRGLLVPG